MLPIYLLMLQAAGPPNPDFDYSGIPTFDAAPNDLAVKSHSATLEVGNDTVSVSTVTQIRNLTNSMLTVRIHIPRYRRADLGARAPDFPITASINNHPLTLHGSVAMPPIIRQAKSLFIRNEVETTLYLAKNTTYGLRISYRVPVGRAGFDRKMRLVGYSLGGGLPIEQFVMSYRTAPGVVFRLPKPSPDLGWQIGERGAFVKKSSFTPGDELTYVTYYPAGFEDIGK